MSALFFLESNFVASASTSFSFENPFRVMLVVSAPFFWGFLGLVGLGLMVLRTRSARQPEEQSETAKSHFRTPLYPLEPIILTLSCFAMVYASVEHVIHEKYWAAAGIVTGMMVAGVIVGFCLPADKKDNT